AVDWTLRQAEETYCDFIGVRLFGVAYLQAFAYLLSPNIGAGRPVYYPAMRTRVRNLSTASQKYGFAPPGDYAGRFTDSARVPLDTAGTFLSDVADRALEPLVDRLVTRADDEIRAARVEKPSEAQIDRIVARFRQVVPAEDAA